MSLTDAFLLDSAPFNVWIAYRGDGAGSGTANDPYDGKTPARFDAIMSSLGSLFPHGQVHVHLGPSPRDGSGNPIPFETTGYPNASGWQPISGMKLVGSGIDVTVLRLVNPTNDEQNFAIGHALTTGSPARPNPLDVVEISDLTIDCNADAAGNQAACGAVRLMGSHCRIHRVKAINWGTKTTVQPCHALSLIVATGEPALLETVNSGIENCIAILPSHNSKREAVALHIGGIEGSNGVQGYGRSPFVRNNYVDGASAAGGELAILTATTGTGISGTTGTFVGKRPHHRSVNEYAWFTGPAGSMWNGHYRISEILATPANAFKVDLSSAAGNTASDFVTCGAEIRAISVTSCRGGIVEGNQIHNVWLGGPYAGVLNTKEIIIRNNTYKNVVTGPYWKAGALGNASGTVVASETNDIVTITTPFPHNLYAKAWIQVLSSGNPVGFYQLTKVVDADHFEYSNPTAPSAPVTFKLVQGVDKLVAEGNVIELADLDETEYAAPNLADSPDYLPIAILVRNMADGEGPSLLGF